MRNGDKEDGEEWEERRRGRNEEEEDWEERRRRRNEDGEEWEERPLPSFNHYYHLLGALFIHRLVPHTFIECN